MSCEPGHLRNSRSRACRILVCGKTLRTFELMYYRADPGLNPENLHRIGMKKLLFALLLIVSAIPLRAGIVIAPWEPLFKGIEHAVGTNTPDGEIPALQVSHCMKIDL